MIYIYKHPEEEEYIEVVQAMSEKHIFFKDDVEWKRIYTSPEAIIGSFSKLNPNSYNDFNSWIDKGKGGSIGSIWDASRELSDRRTKERGTGQDPIKDQALKEYSSARNGMKHPSQLNKS